MRSIRKAFMFDDDKATFELIESEHGTPIENRISENPSCSGEKRIAVSKSLEENLSMLRKDFRSDISMSLVIREFMLGEVVKSAVVFMNGLSDTETINNNILREGMRKKAMDGANRPYIDYAVKNVFSANDVGIETDYTRIKQKIMEGQAVILIDGEDTAAVFDTRKYPQRSIETAENEKSVLGPREGFIENMRTNLTLIRRLIHSDDLVCEMRTLGEENNMTVGIVYREGVANVSLVDEVKRRISGIKLKKIFSTGTIEQLIENSAMSPIPQMLLTERPDRCASFLMDGHIVLLCDGSPLAGILPITVSVLMSTSEDSYARQSIGSIMRVIRYAGAIASLLLPGIFTAVVMFHQGFLSYEFLSTLISSRRMVFVPVGVELLMLLLVFQLVREAGMRVPGSIGQAIGIIGGLVLGQAAVAANVASSIVLIIVALTGLGNFCIPDYSTQLCALYFRIAFVLLGWMGGFLGLTCGLVVGVAYLASLKSFGVPFLAPYTPKTYSKRPFLFRGRIQNGDMRGIDYMNTQKGGK